MMWVRATGNDERCYGRQLLVIGSMSCMFGPMAVRAQQSFMYSYGGSGTEYGYDIAVRPDGQYAIAAQTQTAAYVFGSCEGFFPVMGSGGTLSSARSIGKLSCDVFHAVESLPDTGVLLVGTTLSYGLADDDAQVLRLNKNGGVVWAKRVGGTGYDVANASTLTHDGGVVIAGLYTNPVNNGDPWIAKLSGTGTMVWSTVLTAPGFERFNSVERTADNGFIACGQSNNYGGGPDAFVAKFSSAGVLQWNRAIVGSSSDEARQAIEVIGGGYMITGYTYSFGAGAKDIFLCKLDASGNLVWYKTYGDTNPNDGYGLIQEASGSLVVAGTTEHGFFTNDDVFLLKTSAAGVLTWAKEYGHPTRLERGHALKVAPDGGFVVTGDLWGCPGSTYEVLLLKTQPNGYCPNCDTLNVTYASNTYTPTLATGVGTSTGGAAVTISPSNQVVGPNMTPCNNEIVLPIQLTSFTGESRDDGNHLFWTSATETNNDHFTVQRSGDGSEFIAIGVVDGAGNSQQAIDYAFVDRSPLNGSSYYRLQQTDHDGTMTYSEVIVLGRGVDGSLYIFPNPSSDVIVINGVTLEADTEITVHDAVGRLVIRTGPRAALQIAHLIPGIYWLQVLAHGRVAGAQRFVKE